MDELARLEAVYKRFSTDSMHTDALAGVSLAVHRGDYVAITGPSGSGKSTLLAILGFLDQPTSGHYYFQGADVKSLSRRQLRKLRQSAVGFVFQDFNLVDSLTVLENVTLPLRCGGMGDSKERRVRAVRVLERVGLAERASHYPAQLSGGQKQRAAVARALVGDPVLLLADEPTGNLDSANGGEIMALFAEANGRGTAVVLVTHDEHWAAMASRRLRLFDGRQLEAQDLRERGHGGGSAFTVSTGPTQS